MSPHPSPGALAINVPLYAIRHTQIGGTEFGIYSLVKGLAQTDARLRVTYGHDQDLSAEMLAWLGQHADQVDARRRGGLPGPKSVRFLEETMFGLQGSDDDWAVFPNYFCPPRRPWARRRHAVITHDIQYKIYPQYHSAKRRAWLDAYLPQMFRRADRVILVSQSEADLVRQHFGDAAADRCRIVPNAIDWTRFENTGGDWPSDVQERLGHRYILSICHLFPHKNVITLLQAFTRVAKNDLDVRLYLVGSLSDRNRAFIRASIPDDLVDRVQILGFVDDRTLGAYYAHASLFALPSLYEGFGVPPVEAMGFGVPALVSRCFALPEATLNAAHYVDDPLDVAEWQTRIETLLATPQPPSSETIERVRSAYAPKAVGNQLLDCLRNAE